MSAIQPTVTMPPSEQEVTLKASIGQLIEASKSVVILTHADLSQATDLCKAIKERLKEAENARTSITEPINKGLRELNGRFKAMTAPLDDAERAVKSKMVQFQDGVERRAREEAAQKEAARLAQLKIDEDAAAARAKEEAAQASDPTLDRPAFVAPAPAPAVPAVAPIQPVFRQTTYGQSGARSTFKKVWTFDPHTVDLSKVPVQFLALDESKVNQAIKAGIREIAGVTIFEKTVAAVG